MVLLVGQRTVEEATRPPGELGLGVLAVAVVERAALERQVARDRALERGLELDPRARPGVLAHRQHHDRGGDRERCVEILALRDHLEAQLVAGIPLEAQRLEREDGRLEPVVDAGDELARRRVVHLAHGSSGARLVLQRRVVGAHAGTRHEAQRGIEVRLDLARGELPGPEVVRRADRGTVGEVVPERAAALRLQQPDARGQVLVAQEPARAVVPVQAVGLVRARTGRIAAGEDAAQRRSLAQVVRDARDGEVALGHALGRVGAHVERADVPALVPPGDLAAVEDRDFLPGVVQPHAAAEERDQVVAQVGELEDARVLQEERALLGEEEREARQVELARVGLGLGEVRVDRQHRLQAGRDAIEGVQPRLAGRLVRAGRAVVHPVAVEEGHHVETQPLVQPVQARQIAGFRDQEDGRVVARARPAVDLVAALDPAVDVEAPGPARGIEGQRLERDRELRRPALGIDRRRALPDPVPGLVEVLTVVRDQRVALVAGGVDLEEVGVAPVVEAVDHDLEPVVVVEHGVAGHLGGDDPRRIAVEAAHADVERVLVEEDADLGAFAGRRALVRLDLGQRADLRRLAPALLVQPAVDPRRHGHVRGADRGLARVGLLERQQDRADHASSIATQTGAWSLSPARFSIQALLTRGASSGEQST